MAEENLNWLSTPTVVNETVLAAKEFLDAELAKSKDWNHVNKSIKMIFASNSQFQNGKKNGVGQKTILKFLSANWKQWMVQEALRVLDSEKKGLIDRKTQGNHLQDHPRPRGAYKSPCGAEGNRVTYYKHQPGPVFRQAVDDGK